VAAGKLEEAASRYEAVSSASRELATDNPSSSAAQRDVSVSFSKLGDVLVTAGKLEEARQRYEQSHQIIETLAKANPSSADAQRDVSVSLKDWEMC